jgi:hypothetical protein
MESAVLGNRGIPTLAAYPSTLKTRAGVEEAESSFTAKVLPARARAPDGAKTIGVQEGEAL